MEPNGGMLASVARKSIPSETLTEVVWGQASRHRHLNLDAGNRLGAYSVEVPEDAQVWVLPGGQYALPARMTVQVRDSRYPKVFVDLELDDGELVCTGIHRQPGAEPLTGRRLRRLALDEIAEYALQSFAVRVREGDDGNLHAQLVRRIGEWETFFAKYDEQRERPRRGLPKDQQHYERVAERWKRARAEGRAPVKAIETEMFASPTTANRWIKEARRLGLIPTAPARARR